MVLCCSGPTYAESLLDAAVCFALQVFTLLMISELTMEITFHHKQVGRGFHPALSSLRSAVDDSAQWFGLKYPFVAERC